MSDAGQSLIATLGLQPHPEGGHYRRIHVSTVEVEANGLRRPAMTAIHYLLQAGERSRWHRIDADEAWHWQRGDALELLQYDARTGALQRTRLGPDPQREVVSCLVPASVWQAARPLGDHALVLCTVAPGFAWERFEWLPDDSALAKSLPAP